jgi:KRAB domain-containing zinc finger protein
MSTQFTPCDIFENLRQFQQSSLFTDISICCYDGSLSAHKAMLVDVFNSLGITELDKVDGLIFPNLALAQLDFALACLYGEGGSDQMVKICSFMKAESQVSDSNQETNDVANQENSVMANKEPHTEITDVEEPVTVSSHLKQERLYSPGGTEHDDDEKLCTNSLAEAKQEGISAKKPLDEKQIKKRYFCDQCEYITTHKKRLAKHRVTLHEKIGYKCEYCDFHAKGKYKVDIHRREAHPNLREIKMLKKISCDLCDFVAKPANGRPRPDRLPVHMRIVHGEKFPCDQCHRIFLKQEKLKVHQLYAHDDRIHKCDQCEYETKNKWQLMSHNRIKHTDQMFYCDQCEFSTKRMAQMTRHVQVKHEGIRYYCEQCEYSATYKSGLRRHILIMHEGVSCSCDFCEHKSSTKANLNLHMDAKHLGIKYECDECEFKGSQPGTLKIHKKTRHQN